MFALKNILPISASAKPIQGVTAVISNQTNFNQSRPLCRKSKLVAKKTFRWPYERIPWNYFTMWADLFTKRKFNENTKLVVVDGNVAAGKEPVAKRLAEELGLLYLPPNLDLDQLYINEHGYDYRAMNPLLPERLRICDFDMFHQDPSRLSVCHLQHYIFKLRIYQYLKALRHIFNTGQGVVLTRSALSDRAFVEAMHNCGWLPRGYVRGDGVRFYDWKLRYQGLRNFIFSLLPKPHLVVYVDTPVDVCLERIKQDPNPNVRNSKALTREFLDEIETAYKDVVLPKCDNNGIVHTISGAEPYIEDDFVDLIDEIEAMDFELDPHDTRFNDWDDKFGNWYLGSRRYYTSIKVMNSLEPLGKTPYFDIAGLGDCISRGDLVLRDSLYEQCVADLGYSKTFESNRKLNGWLRATFGLEDFEKRLERELRLDFR